MAMATNSSFSGTISRSVSVSPVSICGGAPQFATPNACSCRDLQGVQFNGLRLGIEGGGRFRIRVRFGVSSDVTMSLNGGESGEVEGSEIDAAMWLREKLGPQLESDGVGVDQSRRIAEACADACASFLATGRAFDPLMITDAMEEEIERRDLRGDDFLPFELGRKAAKVLTQRWNELPVTERPKTYRQQPYVNRKDVVDFDKWPKNLNLP